MERILILNDAADDPDETAAIVDAVVERLLKVHVDFDYVYSGTTWWQHYTSIHGEVVGAYGWEKFNDTTAFGSDESGSPMFTTYLRIKPSLVLGQGNAATIERALSVSKVVGYMTDVDAPMQQVRAVEQVGTGFKDGWLLRVA